MRKALIVGINDYPGEDALTGCINDATAVATTLSVNGDGSPNFDVLLKTNVKTKSDLKTLLAELFSGDSDIALFYFAGHGAVNELGGYLVTPDGKKYDEGISMHDLLTFSKNSKVKDKVIILDCCHSGAMGSIGNDFPESHLKEGTSILTASKSDEPSMETPNGHGVFTELLLSALQGGAADLRGHISPGGIYAYIDQALGPWDQRPVFKTNVTRFTSLRTIQPQVSPETLRKIAEYFPNPQDDYKLDPSYEDTNSKEVTHELKEPYAKKENVIVFKDLQKLQSVGLVVPVDASYMYFAAMESKACKLTSLGYHYWRLVKDKRI